MTDPILKTTKKEYKKAIRQADSWAKKEIKKYGSPPIYAYQTANQAGLKIAAHYKINKDLILLGTILMDISLGKAISQNKLKEHAQLCFRDSKLFLNKFKLPKQDKIKILEGVRYHHGRKKFKSLEAEVIMNADCYKFLKLGNIKKYLQTLRLRGLTQKDAVQQAKNKFREKQNGLSLDYCIKELSPEIKKINNYFKTL